MSLIHKCAGNGCICPQGSVAAAYHEMFAKTFMSGLGDRQLIYFLQLVDQIKHALKRGRSQLRQETERER